MSVCSLFCLPFSVLPRSCMCLMSFLDEALLWRETLQQRGKEVPAGALQQGWLGRTIGGEGNLSYMRVSLASHVLYSTQ